MVFCLLLSFACTNQVGSDDPLGQLSIRLNSKFRRELDKNSYSLSYYPKAPSTIVVKVRYQQGSDLSHIRSIVHSARSHIQHYATEEYGMSISTEEDIAPLP